MKEVVLNINGMSCQHCVKHVKKALENLQSVTDLDVQIGKAALKYDESQLTLQTIQNAIQKAGYTLA